MFLQTNLKFITTSKCDFASFLQEIFRRKNVQKKRTEFYEGCYNMKGLPLERDYRRR